MTCVLRRQSLRLCWIAPLMAACLAVGPAGAQAVRSETAPPFSNATPSRIVRVSPGQDIDAVLHAAAPGVAFVFEDGDYGPVTLPRAAAGAAERPIWLISRHLHGARVETIRGGASKNLVIEGFHVTSAHARNGIEIVANVGGKGRPFVWSDANRLTANIVIRDVLVDAPGMDAIKMTGGSNLWIIDSDLTGGARGQGVDVDASRQVFILRNRATTLGPLASIMVKFGTVGALIAGNECWSNPGVVNDGIHIGDRSGPQTPPPHAQDGSGRLAFEARDVVSRGNRCVVSGRPLVFIGAAPPCQSIGDYLESTSPRSRLVVGATSRAAAENDRGKPGPGHPDLPSGACEVREPIVRSMDNLLKNADASEVRVAAPRLADRPPPSAVGPAPYTPPAWLGSS